MQKYDDIKEEKVNIDTNLTNNKIEKYDKIIIKDKIKKGAYYIFMNENKKKIKESKNSNYKYNRLEINIIRINLIKLIVFINLFVSLISSQITITTKESESVFFKICKCGNSNRRPSQIVVDGSVIRNIQDYPTDIIYYQIAGEYIYVKTISGNGHTIKLSWEIILILLQIFKDFFRIVK